MIVYQIKLPKKQNAEKFATFMRGEYFPAIHKGATRVGQVTSLLLLQSQSEAHEFFWLVGWSGLSDREASVDDKKVLDKLKTFNANIKRLGTYEEVATWPTNE